MPAAYTNQRRDRRYPVAPVTPSSDDEEGDSPVPEAPDAGLAPREPVEIRHARAAKNLEDTYAAQVNQRDPFRFSGEPMPQLPGEFYQTATRAADVAYNDDRQRQREEIVSQRRQQRAQVAQLNSADIAKYKGSGQQYYTDPASGRLTPVLEQGTGRALYHKTGWEQGVDPQGKPALVMRDQYGQRQSKAAPVVSPVDPSDDQMYYKLPDGTTEPAGAIGDFINHPNYSIAKAARTARTANIKAIHAQALEPMKLLQDDAQAKVEQAKTQIADMDGQIENISRLAADNADTPLGEGYAAQLSQLQGRRDSLSERLKPRGDLSSLAARSSGHYRVARAKAMRDTFAAQQDEIIARVKASGGDLNKDPAYIGNSMGLQAAEEAVRNGETDIQQQEVRMSGGSVPVGQPAASSTAAPLNQSEPFVAAQRGEKAIGSVGLKEFARRYGDGSGPVQPDSLLHLKKRMDDIDQTLANPNTSLNATIQGKLGEERNYVDSLYKQRFAKLDPETQKRIDKTLYEQTTSTGGALARSAATGITPAAGALAGFEAGAALGAPLAAPTRGIAPLVLGALGAFAGSILANKAQKSALKKVAPEAAGELERLQAVDSEQHPLATTAGEVLSNLPVFKVNPLMAARGLAALSKIARGATVTESEKAAAKVLALQGGFATATAVAQPLLQGEKPTLGGVTQSVAQMMLFGDGRIGRKGAGPIEVKPTEPIKPTLTPEQQAAEIEFQKKLNESNLSSDEKAHVEQLRSESEPASILQEPTTPAQHSALAIHQGLKAQEALRQTPEGGKLLKAQLGKEAVTAESDSRRLSTPELEARRDAIEKQLADQERLRQSPEGGTKLTQVLAETEAQQKTRVDDFYRAHAEEIEKSIKDAQLRGGEGVQLGADTGISKAADDAQNRLTALDIKLGSGEGATKERARLISIIESERGKAVITPEQEKISGTGSAPTEVAGNETVSSPALIQEASIAPKSEAVTNLVPKGTQAPVQFLSHATAEGFPEIWNLTEDIPGHPKDSTVSRAELEKAGYEVPPAPEQSTTKSNATNQGQQPESDQLQHTRAPSGSAVSENGSQVREGQGEQASGGNRALEVPRGESVSSKAENQDVVREKVKPVESVKDSPLTGANESMLMAVAKELGLDPKGMSGARLRARIESNAHPDDIKAALENPAKPDIIERLQSAKRSKRVPGASYFIDPDGGKPNTAFDAAHDAAIDIAILGVRAGRAVADVVKLAVQRFKARYPSHTPEQLAKVEASIRDSISPKEPVPVETKPAKILNPSTRTKIIDAWKKSTGESDLKKTLSVTRDAADNEAHTVARETRNTVRNELLRSIPEKDAGVAQDALAFHVEAGEDGLKKLAEMRQKIESSTKADPKWKKRALKAIDYASVNYDKLKSSADLYREFTDRQVQQEQDAGMPTLKKDNYVMHAQDVEDGSWLGTGGGMSPTGASNRKNRTFDTFANSIAAGIDPKTLNGVDLLESRVRAGQMGVNLRQWQESLKDYKDPTTKQPIAQQPEKVARADGSIYYQSPKGYETEMLGNTPIAVKKEYAGIVGALTDPSWWSKAPERRLIQKLNGAGKSINLLIDTFHLGRLALRQSILKSASLSDPRLPRPSYQEGKTILEHSPEELSKMAVNGEISKEALPALLEKKKNLGLLTRAGLNTGHVADAMHQELIAKLPFLGDVNKFIFEKFQRGAMAESALMEFERQSKSYPDLKPDEVARKVASDINTRFGNLGRQGIFKSRTAQDIARLIWLAPQWNEGLIRSELGGVGQIGKSMVDAATGRRFAMGALGRDMIAGTLGIFAGNQLINQLTRGKFTWENPEEGWGAKLSAWIPDKVGGKGAGFFLNPMGVTAEISHMLLNSYERKGSGWEAAKDFFRSRSSAVARPIVTAATGKDALGGNIKPSNYTKEVLKSSAPVPIGGSAAYSAARGLMNGGNTELYPGQFQKQVMQTLGLKTDTAPSPEQRVQALAKEFNRTKKIEPAAEFYAGDYTDLTNALRRNNPSDIKDEIKTLMAKKTPDDIKKHYQSWGRTPFTGQRTRETEFLRTLSAEQRSIYSKAQAARKDIGSRALNAVNKIPLSAQRN